MSKKTQQDTTSKNADVIAAQAATEAKLEILRQAVKDGKMTHAEFNALTKKDSESYTENDARISAAVEEMSRTEVLPYGYAEGMRPDQRKTRAEQISAAQAGSDDAAAQLTAQADAKQARQDAHDDVSTGRVRVEDMQPRAGLLTDQDQAERNASARDKRAKPAEGIALQIMGHLKAGRAPHEVVSIDGVVRIDRLHYVLTAEGISGYRFTLVTEARDKDGATIKDNDGNAKTSRTNLEVLNLTGGGYAVDTVTSSDMKTTQDNATPRALMLAAIAKAEAKGKLSARLTAWKATLTNGAAAQS